MIDYTLPLEELPDPLPIEPLKRPFDVTITPPGSKSITNRAYVLAALAEGESRIIRPLRADDTDLLLNALCTLGADAKWVAGQTGDGSEDVLIKGVAGRFPRGGYINLGDGGTPTRFMIACACLAEKPVVVDGSARMRERPIAEGVEMLRQLGAKIEYVDAEGRLPVRVRSSEEFKGGEITVGKTQSSQFISAVMLIAPVLSKGLRCRFSKPPTSVSYLQLTLEMLINIGVSAHERFALAEVTILSQPIRWAEHFVQPDASSALYWWCAATLNTDAVVHTPGMGGFPYQPDGDLARRLSTFGAQTWHTGSTETTSIEDSIIHVRGGPRIRAFEQPYDLSSAPDGALAVAALMSCAVKSSELTGLHTLRVKETDRIAALASELRKVGCEVETTEDSITIRPIDSVRQSRAGAAFGSDPPAEPGAKGHPSEPIIIIETYNDHRMAMAFAVLGLRVPGIQIRNPACVKKSYPGFWKDFQKLYDNPRK